MVSALRNTASVVPSSVSSRIATAKVIAPRIPASIARAASSFDPAPVKTLAQPKHVPLPSLSLTAPKFDWTAWHKVADPIASSLHLGAFKGTGGVEGELWLNYESGSVAFGGPGLALSGAWVGGPPLSGHSTFLPLDVVKAAQAESLGGFIRETKLGGETIDNFTGGAVKVDAQGKVEVSHDPLQFQADALAETLGLGAFQHAGGGDGGALRTYEKGTIDGDITGNVRGLWLGGDPWSTPNAAFVGKDVLDSAIENRFGHILGTGSDGDRQVTTFERGFVIREADGSITPGASI